MINPELALRIVRTSRLIAYDTETSGLDPVKDFICGYVVTDKENSLYVPVRHEGGGNIPNVAEFEAQLNAAFKDRSRLGYRTVGHHLGFDLRFSNRHGVYPNSPLEDTMINELLIDDRTRSFSLDECCKRHQVTAKLGAELYQHLARKFGGIPDKKQMGNFWRLAGDDPLVVDYAVGDGISTLELWESQQHLLDTEELRVPWQLECDLLPYMARIHAQGIRVDPEYSEKVVADLKTDTEELKKQFTPGFNVRSPQEVEGLYRTNGYGDADFARTPPSKKHPQGQISFREKWLETNEIGRAILSVRRLEKAKDSFITPLTDTFNVNGKVYPILNQSKSDDYGVAGARLSCSLPNLQAYPKRNKEIGKRVRRLVIPDDGMVIEEADAMQQEPRLFTHYSQDPDLLAGYRAGTMDLHDRANELLFNNEDRDSAKRMAMGMLTMMFPKTLAGHMSWDLARAKRAHKMFLEDAFPLIGQFQEDAISVFENRGYVKSILGRRARMESRRFSYQAVSRIIQNSGGDHIKTCILRACQYQDAYPQKVQLLLSIHDSLMWQRDPSHSPRELIKLIESVAQEPQFNISIPMPFELGSGKNWAEASYSGVLKGKKGWVDGVP